MKFACNDLAALLGIIHLYAASYLAAWPFNSSSPTILLAIIFLSYLIFFPSLPSTQKTAIPFYFINASALRNFTRTCIQARFYDNNPTCCKIGGNESARDLALPSPVPLNGGTHRYVSILHDIHTGT